MQHSTDRPEQVRYRTACGKIGKNGSAAGCEIAVILGERHLVRWVKYCEMVRLPVSWSRLSP